MGALKPSHLIVLAIVVLVLFGAKKLPDFARSLGQSLRIFKSETKALRDDDQQPTPTPPGVVSATGETSPFTPTETPGTPPRADS